MLWDHRSTPALLHTNQARGEAAQATAAIVASSGARHRGSPSLVQVPVILHRCGEFRLKGVNELVAVAQLMPLSLLGRLKHWKPPTSLKVRHNRKGLLIHSCLFVSTSWCFVPYVHLFWGAQMHHPQFHTPEGCSPVRLSAPETCVFYPFGLPGQGALRHPVHRASRGSSSAGVAAKPL